MNEAEPKKEASTEQVAVRKITKKRIRKKPTADAPKIVGWKSYLCLIFLVSAVFSPLTVSEFEWSNYDLVDRNPHQSKETSSHSYLDALRKDAILEGFTYKIGELIPIAAPHAHRIINILLHIIAALLLLKILEILKLAHALPAALIFALHPSTVQVLFWPGYRTEILGLIVILAALFFGFRNKNIKDYVATCLLSITACFIHPSAYFIPIILALMIFAQKKQFSLPHYNRVFPIFISCLLIGVWIAEVDPVRSTGPDGKEQMVNAGQNMFFYIKQTFLPLWPQLFYPNSATQNYASEFQLSFLPFIIFIPIIAIGIIKGKKTWARYLLMGIITYLLLIIYGVSRDGRFLDGTRALEDYGQYTALPVLIALALGAISKIAELKPSDKHIPWRLTVTAILCGQIFLSTSFSLAISNETKMWQKLERQWPESWVPKAALVDQSLGSNAPAISENQQILFLEYIVEKQPDRLEKRQQLARKYAEQGQPNNAAREYRKILRDYEPDNAFLEEAANFFKSVGAEREASSTRDRIKP